MEDDFISGADPRRPEVRIGWEIASAEHASRTANRAMAELWRPIEATLIEAREHPEVFGRERPHHGGDGDDPPG